MKRKSAPDILKGIAVILMIQVHLTELFATAGFYASTAGRVSLFLGGSPAAPVFMAVMGYFLAYSGKSMMQEVFRGIKLIFLGLILNILLNAHAMFYIFTGHLNLNALHMIFGVDILFLAGFSIIIIALLKPLIRKHFVIPFLIALIVAACSLLFNNVNETENLSDYLVALAGGHFSWSYFPLIPWLAYPLAGFGYKLFEDKFPFEKFSKGLFAVAMLVLLISLTITLKYGISITSDLKTYYHHDILYTAWVFGFLIFYSGIIRLISVRFNTSPIIRSLMWVGKNVTAFYVIQWILIGNIATTVYKTQEWPWLLVWFAGITGVSVLMVWVWNKIVEQRNKDKVF